MKNDVESEWEQWREEEEQRVNVCVCLTHIATIGDLYIDSAISFDIEQINTDQKSFLFFSFSVLEFQFIIFMVYKT